MGWILVFALVGVTAGFVTAGIFLAFMSVGTGFSEVGLGSFLLLGMLCSLGFFAWGMSIRERFRMMSNRPGNVGAFRARIEAEKKRAEDPFYEPSPFFLLREGKKKPVIDPSWGVPLKPDGDAPPNVEGDD
ncbi:MAG: hypothetical protein QOG04_544 [Actinomycetota bacterium]|nr:hypothetical protein [Actinomycetota bacterium]